MNKKALFAIIAIVIAVIGAGVFHFMSHNAVVFDKTVKTGNTEYKYDQVEVQTHKGFAENDKDGNLKEISKDDPRVQEISSLAIQWGQLVSDRSYQTIEGNEEYGLYTPDLVKKLNKDGDAENTVGAYDVYDLITKGSNYKVTNVIIFPDGRAFAQMESDLEVVATSDPEGVKDFWGFETGKAGDVKHYKYGIEFETIDGKYMISAANPYQTDAILVD